MNHHHEFPAIEEEQIDVSDEYLDAFAEFTDALVTGKNPDLEEHLSKYPQFVDELRPVLETAIWVREEFQRFKREYPDVDILDLLDMPEETKAMIRKARRRKKD